jgi:NitT/TauT family transport system ATP-binding protein
MKGDFALTTAEPARPPILGRPVVRPREPLPVAQTAPKVVIKDVRFYYKKFEALKGINLALHDKRVTAFIGPSGCGKSTLLHLIAGLQPPTSGLVVVDGKVVHGPGTDRIMIFQDHALFPWLTVAQNVEFGMKMKGVPRAERQEKTRQYLRLVHLAKFENSYIHQLSGGMRQRVAIARALATEPDILLMDEPFAALDAQTRDLLHDELERIWNETGRTILFVTHNVREAVRLGDRVVLLTFRPGRVKREFPIDLPRPRHIEDVAVARTSRAILDELRGEINRSLEAEYQAGVKPRIEPGVSA